MLQYLVDTYPIHFTNMRFDALVITPADVTYDKLLLLLRHVPDIEIDHLYPAIFGTCTHVELMERVEGIAALHHQWGHTICNVVAYCNDLEALKYFRGKRHPWTSQVYTAAMQFGNLEMFRYALANGCPTTPICVVLPPKPTPEFIKLILELCENEPLSVDLVDCAAKHNLL